MSSEDAVYAEVGDTFPKKDIDVAKNICYEELSNTAVLAQP